MTCLLFAFNKVQAQDAISSVTAPAEVTQGTTVVVTVNYVATTTEDIVVTIQENGGTWATYGTARVTVNAGTSSVNVNLPISSTIPVATNAYKIGTYMTTVASFSASTTSYDVTVVHGTTSVTIGATATDAGATVTGTGSLDVTSGSGTANVVVTAQDGTTTKTYTVNVTVAQATGIHEVAKDVTVYPTVSNGTFNVALGEATGIVKVFNLIGNFIVEKTINGVGFINVPYSGIYLIDININGQHSIFKVIKK